MDKLFIIILVLGALAVGALGGYYFGYDHGFEQAITEQQNQTEEPQNGSANAAWETYTDSDTGVSFKYPETLTATYVSVVDWPPMVQVLDEPLACTEAGEPMARAGRTEVRMVDDRVYCVTEVVEGAAGSIYTQYAYAFQRTEKTILLTFSVRKPQCVNYDEPSQTACKNEQEAFDVDGMLDRIVQTLTIEN